MWHVLCFYLKTFVHICFCLHLQQRDTSACIVCGCIGCVAVNLPDLPHLLSPNLWKPWTVSPPAARTEVEGHLGHPVPTSVEGLWPTWRGVWVEQKMNIYSAWGHQRRSFSSQTSDAPTPDDKLVMTDVDRRLSTKWKMNKTMMCPHSFCVYTGKVESVAMNWILLFLQRNYIF